MRNQREIQNRIDELAPMLELAEESYFSAVSDKESGNVFNEVDFLKLESEMEIIKSELEALEWVLEPAEIVITQEFEILRETEK